MKRKQLTFKAARKRSRKQIQSLAISHYKRMIAWAEKQHPCDRTFLNIMRREIKEIWYADDCAYCKKYALKQGDICRRCPLQGQDRKFCCNGHWEKMNMSFYWKEWLKHAKKVLQYIEEQG